MHLKPNSGQSDNCCYRTEHRRLIWATFMVASLFASACRITAPRGESAAFHRSSGESRVAENEGTSAEDSTGAPTPAPNAASFGGSNTDEGPREEDYPPLALAALAGDLAKVRELVKIGQDINGTDASGRTPLMYALRPRIMEPAGSRHSPSSQRDLVKSKLRIAFMLIDRGADVTRATKDGTTALHYAALMYAPSPITVQIARKLLSNNASIHARTAQGKTPLFFAVERRNIELASFLFEAGADPHTDDANGDTPMSLARHLKLDRLVLLFSGDTQPKAPRDQE